MVLAFPQERVLDLLVVFDHPIVDEGELAALVEMRMRVLIGRLAVRRPARVTNAVGTGGGGLGNQFRQASDAAGTFARFNVIAIDNRDSGGIVAAVFEPAQTIEQNGRGLRFSDVSDNATHGLLNR